MRKVWLALAVVTMLSSCETFGKWDGQTEKEISEAGIRVVSNPGYIQDMTFVSGYTTPAGWLYSAQDIGNRIAADAVSKGYRDCTILVELVSRGAAMTDYSWGSANIWRISVYKQSSDDADVDNGHVLHRKK